jgi:hypothetical protein
MIASDLILLTDLQAWHCKKVAYVYGSISGFSLTGQHTGTPCRGGSWKLIVSAR